MAGDASAANMNAANSADTIVWISGANFGIGAGLARHVPWPGARIINLDLKPSPLYETVLFDLARPETWDTVRGHFESELATFRGKRAIFMVVGHANLAQGLAAKIDTHEYRSALIANGVAPLALANDFLRAVKPGYESGVMLMSSGAAHAQLVGQSAYGASKAGIEHWVRVMRRELAETGRDSWVVAVRPGAVITPPVAAVAALDDKDYPGASRVRASLATRVDIDEAGRRIWAALPPAKGISVISFGGHPTADREFGGTQIRMMSPK